MVPNDNKSRGLGDSVEKLTMKNFKEFNEDAVATAANNASSGAVAGLGNEPPVSVKGQKSHKKRVQKMTQGITAGRKVMSIGTEGY